jgi:hypothetical protein
MRCHLVVDWRSGTLQVFLDVVESVNLLVNSNGTVVRSEVVGALKMRTYLSGMPECKLGLNDKASLSTFCCGLVECNTCITTNMINSATSTCQELGVVIQA